MRSCHPHDVLNRSCEAQHLTSSMTIPWKPDAQKGVYTVSLRLVFPDSSCMGGARKRKPFLLFAPPIQVNMQDQLLEVPRDHYTL